MDGMHPINMLQEQGQFLSDLLQLPHAQTMPPSSTVGSSTGSCQQTYVSVLGSGTPSTELQSYLLLHVV